MTQHRRQGMKNTRRIASTAALAATAAVVAPGVAQTGAAARESAQPCISEQSGNAGPGGSWAEYAARNAPAMIA